MSEPAKSAEAPLPYSSPPTTAAPARAAAQPLRPRGDGPAPLVFKKGAHWPFAVRWFGVTSLFGHARNLAASAIASEQIDSRDWMRPQRANELLAAMLDVLGGAAGAPSLVEGLGRPVWIDFVADTGDDRDVSAAVGEMLARRYDDGGRELPRGDVLVFGGDTAYPVATASEIHARVIEPWSAALRAAAARDGDARRRVLLGIPGNHDWYDGLDGFARLFRAEVDVALDAAPGARGSAAPGEGRASRLVNRKTAFVVRQLHLDEWGAFFRIVRDLGASIRALWRGKTVSRRKRLALPGYDAVQEATYWTFPLAPGLDAYGVDRQLSRLDFRQRAFFRRRRAERPDARVLFIAPDPAIAFGETWEPGAGMLRGCRLDLDEDDLLYMTGDMHHYERRRRGRSMHVIAGGGGAFLHGTRIGVGPGGPADAAYPNGATCRRLVAAVPLRLMLGGSGFLVHFGFGALAAVELAASLRGTTALVVVAALVSLALTIAFYVNAGHNRAHPRKVAAVAVPFGTVLGLLPMALRLALPKLVPELAGDSAVILVFAFLGALGFGLFLATVAVLGLEHQQAYAVLSHPGFKHFVRMCVHPDGRVEAWTIGKDDPLASGEAVLVDRFEW